MRDKTGTIWIRPQLLFDATNPAKTTFVPLGSSSCRKAAVPFAPYIFL